MQTSFTKRQIGAAIEKEVCDYLTQHGLQLTTKNYVCKVGEIYLIMKDQDMLVFVEVRYRKEEEYGDALNSVTPNKRRRIIRAAQYYLQQNDLLDKIQCRFDVVAQNGQIIQWIKNAFWVKW